MKTSMYRFQSAIAAIALVAVLTSCKKSDDDTPAMDSKNIVQVASSDNQFSILAAAVTKAGLASTLSGPGPFTVFAPTNDAFNKLFAKLGVSGLNDLSAETLKPILLNHVISGNIKAADITTGYVATMNNTGPAQNKVKVFILKGANVTVDGSKVIIADVMASNGTIHAVDNVIMPASVVGQAINNPMFSILVQAVVKAKLVDALSAAGPFTVFAPTNDAFNALFTKLGVTGISDLTAAQLTPILLYHVVPANVLASQVTTGIVPTLKDGSTISVMADAMGVKLNNSAKVIATDVQGTNGVVHAIDAVLIP